MYTSLPSQDNPLHVTPDNTSRQTLQKVGFAWEHEYQLCAPDNVSNRSDCYKNENSKVSCLKGDTRVLSRSRQPANSAACEDESSRLFWL